MENNELVVHVTGYFHVKQDLGIVEHLRKYRAEFNATTVVILPEEDPSIFSPEDHGDLGDFVVLTDLNKI